MGKNTGFLEYERVEEPTVSVEERRKNFKEFHKTQKTEITREQAARCMNCGVPFCQSGSVIAGMVSGCPLHNPVPEMNDLVYGGNFEQAYYRLSMTHSFPEFTSRVCPALCEAACTCGLHSKPVTTKANERAVIEYAYENGLVEETTPKIRTGKRVAIVGSGPSGLAAAQLLNRRGHSVTVYERSDRVGGLLRYGIPNMKLDKRVIDRRIQLLEQAGVTFVTGVNVGVDIKAEELTKDYDAVLLACGASNPRDIKVKGRAAKGIYFAVDFLSQVTKYILDHNYEQVPYDLVKDKDVIVVGGGDTGNDCVGTSVRLGAKSVLQLEMMPKLPEVRLESNPWPEWPRVLKTDYGQEEAKACFGQDPRVYQTTISEFKTDAKGNLTAVVLVELKAEKDKKTGRMNMVPVKGSEREVPAQLVLIAAGFLGSQAYVTDAFGVAVDNRTNVKTEAGQYRTGKDKLYTAGDMHRGQSLVVWAIAEGRGAAKEIDEDLMGYSNL